MSSNRLKRLGRAFSVRLSLWYTSIFTFSAAVLFFVVYLLLTSAVQRKDREVIESHLKEFAVIYQSGGVSALRDWTRSDEAEKQKDFFIRVVGPYDLRSQTRPVLFLWAPEDWIQ